MYALYQHAKCTGFVFLCKPASLPWCTITGHCIVIPCTRACKIALRVSPCVFSLMCCNGCWKVPCAGLHLDVYSQFCGCGSVELGAKFQHSIQEMRPSVKQHLCVTCDSNFSCDIRQGHVLCCVRSLLLGVAILWWQTPAVCVRRMDVWCPLVLCFYLSSSRSALRKPHVGSSSRVLLVSRPEPILRHF